MAKTLCIVFMVAMAVAALAAPAEEVKTNEELEASLRLPRATCDLLSAFGVADSACAAHCIAKKYKGGWCEQGVCHCRR